MPVNEICYSERYSDDKFEFRYERSLCVSLMCFWPRNLLPMSSLQQSARSHMGIGANSGRSLLPPRSTCGCMALQHDVR